MEDSTCELSRVRLFATSWTIALQVPLSMEFSRQEYWSSFPFPAPGDRPNLSLMSPALTMDSLPLSHQGSPMGEYEVLNKNHCSTLAPAHILHLPYSMAGPRNAKKNICCVLDLAMHCHTPFQERRCCPSGRKWCQQMAFSCQSLQGLLQWWSCLLQCHALSWGSPCPKTQESPATCFEYNLLELKDPKRTNRT